MRRGLARRRKRLSQEGVMNYKSHPLADVLSLIEGAEFDRLVADIREHGLKDAISLYQGKILDGRNRERACSAAGVHSPLCQVHRRRQGGGGVRPVEESRAPSPR